MMMNMKVTFFLGELMVMGYLKVQMEMCTMVYGKRINRMAKELKLKLMEQYMKGNS